MITEREGQALTEWLVGKLSDFDGDDRLVISTGETEIGVFRSNGDFHAYENFCLHQGGPACEGVRIGKVEAVLAQDRSVIGERFSEEEIHFVCPWHGWEYDLATGECVGDRRMRLRKYEVVQRGDEVYVVE
jgi:nitrite reductase/ring-hydroxylating ferredoxin subunit